VSGLFFYSLDSWPHVTEEHHPKEIRLLDVTSRKHGNSIPDMDGVKQKIRGPYARVIEILIYEYTVVIRNSLSKDLYHWFGY